MDALLASLDSDQWNEWLAWQKDHISEARYLHAAEMCLHANINRDPKKKPTPYKVEDFLPQKRKAVAQDPYEIRARLRLSAPRMTPSKG